jgi:metal-responsive CopG/Arc/MetJ family transcriptional regulator
MDKKISVLIDEDLLKRIDEKAKESLRSRSKFIEYVLREYIKQEEIFKKI